MSSPTIPVRLDVELAPDGHPRAAVAEARLSRSAKVLWDAIVELEAYPGRVPMIHQVRRAGDRVTVQLKFKIALFSVGFEFVADLKTVPERLLELTWVSGEPHGLHLSFALTPDGKDTCVVRARAELDVSSLGWLVKIFLRHHPEIALGVTPGVALNLIDAMRRAVGAELLPPRPPPSIRPAGPADARAIAEVQVAGWHASYRGLMPDARLDAFTVEVRTPAWQGHLSEKKEGLVTMVLERDGEVVAFGSFGPSRDAPGQGEVWALYAHPDAWSTGAGRALMQEGLRFLEARGFTKSMLWVLEGNARAVRFYEAAGFRREGEVVDKDGLPHVQMVR